jgi:hypothetical protein
MAPLDWVLVVCTGIGGVFGLFCLFDGARRIALYGPNSASSYLIGFGAAICLMLASYAYWKYREQQVEAHFVELVMWLVWGASALVFGALFAREPEPERAEEDTKIEPVLAPPVVAQAPQPAAAVASAKPAPATAKPAGAPPPVAPPKPAVGLDTVPLPKPGVGGDTVPLPKPGVGGDTVPLPKPGVGGDTVPLPKPGIPPVTIPLAKPSVGEDTVPLAKPAPGSLSPPPKKP